MCLRHRVANIRIVLVGVESPSPIYGHSVCRRATGHIAHGMLFEVFYTLEPCPVVWLSFWACSEVAKATVPGATQ